MATKTWACKGLLLRQGLCPRKGDDCPRYATTIGLSGTRSVSLMGPVKHCKLVKVHRSPSACESLPFLSGLAAGNAGAGQK